MPKATKKTTTRRDLRPRQVRESKVTGFVETPAEFAGGYGVRVDGDCLAPAIQHDDTVIISPKTKPEVGAIVAVTFRDRRRPIVKRLFRPLPDRLSPAPGDELVMMLALEMDNPPRRFFVPGNIVDTVHTCVGVVRGGKFTALPKPDAPRRRIVPLLGSIS